MPCYVQQRRPLFIAASLFLKGFRRGARLRVEIIYLSLSKRYRDAKALNKQLQDELDTSKSLINAQTEKNVLLEKRHAETIASLEERLRTAKGSYDICLACLQNPDDSDSSLRLTGLLLNNKLAISNQLHEKLLRVQLGDAPHRRDLMRTLITLKLANQGSLIPDIAATTSRAAVAERCPETLAELIEQARQATENGDTVGLYAVLWQAIIQWPRSPLGWAELAFALAARGHSTYATKAVKTTVALGIKAGDPAGRAVVKALNLMAERDGFQHLLCQDPLANLPADVRSSPEAVSLLLHRDVADAQTLVATMLTQHGDDPKANLVAAYAAYKTGDFRRSYDHWLRALRQDGDYTLWQTVTNYGHLVDRAIGEIDVVADVRRYLDKMSDVRRFKTLMPSAETQEARAMAERLRQDALDAGLGSPLLVTQPKSGSVSVGNIFSSGFRLPTVVYSLLTRCVISSWLQDYLLGGACYTIHLLPSADNVDLLSKANVSNVIVHIRDPRQLVVSVYEHYRKYPDQVVTNEQIDYADDEDNRALMAATSRHFPQIIAWVDGWLAARQILNVDFTTFEEFVTDTDVFVDRIVALYGGNVHHFDRQVALTEHTGIDYHRRLGSIDEWRTRFNKAQIDRINSMVPSHFWTVFGWSP